MALLVISETDPADSVAPREAGHAEPTQGIRSSETTVSLLNLVGHRLTLSDLSSTSYFFVFGTRVRRILFFVLIIFRGQTLVCLPRPACFFLIFLAF